MSFVRYETQPPLALVTLERPKALNALDLGMIRDLDEARRKAAEDEDVRAVVIQGAGGRAFSSGGDVRAVALDVRAARDGQSEGTLARDFFHDEYRLNRAIARFDKPWISLLGGIVMGGGAGISVHGSHRVVTERTLFAMPETAIGFFPDVGASYFLSRCPGEIGTWLGLTGARIGAADMLAAGLATHAVSSEAIPRIVDEILAADGSAPAAEVADRVLATHATRPEPGVLDEARPIIDRCFRFDRVVDIVDALEREGGAFAADALASLRAMSPTSLVVTLALLRAGRGRTLDEALVAEYRASQVMAVEPDFYEGIRAVLIDKDKQPRFSPARLEDVDEEALRVKLEAPVERELAF